MQRALFQNHHSNHHGDRYRNEYGHRNDYNQHNHHRGDHLNHHTMRRPLGPLHKNKMNGHRGRFEDSEDSANDEEIEYELSFHLLPDNIQNAPRKMTISIGKDVIDNNDWMTLHA